MKRFVAVWLPYLLTDYFGRKQPGLRKIPTVLASQQHGRMIITAANPVAEVQGVRIGSSVADARAIIPSLHVQDHVPDLANGLLKKIAEWCIRYTPFVVLDPPDGLVLDASGCAHLWGDEEKYLSDILRRISSWGYHVRIAMADTVGCAWAVSRFGKNGSVIKKGNQINALAELPPQGLRLHDEFVVQFIKLGLMKIGQLINMPRSALRRRFGKELLLKIDRALGKEEEVIHPIVPLLPWVERLPCLEPIITVEGIDRALDQLLEKLCERLKQRNQGLRQAILSCYRVDGNITKVTIGTSRPTFNREHVFKLFKLKVESIDPGFGIELFTMEASRVEEVSTQQVTCWEASGALEDQKLAELLDRLSCKMEGCQINRYLPAEHHWPERSMVTGALSEKSQIPWRQDLQRPVHLLSKPERIEVTAPIPDYPPMLFRYKGMLHKVIKADGPERIEQEWWLQQGQHRDYYCVEDEEGRRYWLFRLGHYDDASYQWFIHGFFA